MLSARLPNQLFEQSPFMNSQQKAFGANASWEKRRPNVQCRLPWPVPFSRPAHGSGATRGASRTIGRIWVRVRMGLGQCRPPRASLSKLKIRWVA
jgi:hypothetical protein